MLTISLLIISIARERIQLQRIWTPPAVSWTITLQILLSRCIQSYRNSIAPRAIISVSTVSIKPPSLIFLTRPDVYPLNYLNSSVFDASHQLDIISANLDCSKVSSNCHKLIDQSLCTYGFDGVLTFCLTMYISAAFLFATICTTSVLYQYFDIGKTFTQNEVEEEEFDELNVRVVPTGPYHPVIDEEHKAWYEVWCCPTGHGEGKRLIQKWSTSVFSFCNFSKLDIFRRGVKHATFST